MFDICNIMGTYILYYRQGALICQNRVQISKRAIKPLEYVYKIFFICPKVIWKTPYSVTSTKRNIFFLLGSIAFVERPMFTNLFVTLPCKITV